MHESVMEWGRKQVRRFDLADKDVIEIGSLNVNGSLRGLFNGRYFGIDKLAGPGVDWVEDANTLPLPSNYCDVVVCTEMLAHDPRPWLTIRETYRILRSGGILLLTVRGIGFGRNDSPCDYFRFTEDGVLSLLTEAGFADMELAPDSQYSGVFAWARK